MKKDKKCPICKEELNCINEDANWHICEYCDIGWNFNYNPPAIYYDGKNPKRK